MAKHAELPATEHESFRRLINHFVFERVEFTRKLLSPVVGFSWQLSNQRLNAINEKRVKDFKIVANVRLPVIRESLLVFAGKHGGGGVKLRQLLQNNLQMFHIQASPSIYLRKFIARQFVEQNIFWLWAMVGGANRAEIKFGCVERGLS